MDLHRCLHAMSLLALSILVVGVVSAPASAQSKAPGKAPWTNARLSPDERAALVVKEMTMDEKVSLLHGTGMKDLSPVSALAIHSNGGAGYVVGIPRLGIPAIQMSDAAYGVRHSGDNGRYSTALPADLASAASWDLDDAYEYGALIGRELRDQGYNMSLGGGVNLTREPRNGRTFEYLGEDPLLAGKMVGQVMKGLQAQHVLGDIKHYALNDQESGRNAVNVHIDKRSMRETDLLAFEIGLRESNAAAVMCSYNRVNGDFACENKYLLTDVLKKAWNFKDSSCPIGRALTTRPKPPPPDSIMKSRAKFSSEKRWKRQSNPARCRCPKSTAMFTVSCAPCLPRESSTILRTRRSSMSSAVSKLPSASRNRASCC